MINKQRAHDKPPVAEPGAHRQKPVTIPAGKRRTSKPTKVDTERHYIVTQANIPEMAEKKEEAVTVEEEDDALPYIPPDTKRIKGKLNHIYTAEPL